MRIAMSLSNISVKRKNPAVVHAAVAAADPEGDRIASKPCERRISKNSTSTMARKRPNPD